MEQHIKDFITNIQPGDMQTHKNLAIVPLFMNGNGGPSLTHGLFIIAESDKIGRMASMSQRRRNRTR